MRVLDTKVMRGPNIWSNYRQHLIVMTLDLEELEARPTHRISGFAARIRRLLPTLESHRCSEGHKGGFFQRVEQGTWMGHVIEHIALELQTLAGMPCGYGRTRSADREGVYYVVFAYSVEAAGLYAARAAIRIARALIGSRDYELESDIQNLQKIAAENFPGSATAALLEEARHARIPVKILPGSLLQLGHGIQHKKIRSTVTGSTSGLGIETARDKACTKELLEALFIPTPAGILAQDEEALEEIQHRLKFPWVVKPFAGTHCRGVTSGVKNMEDAFEAFRYAANLSLPVLVEEQASGKDYRLLVVNHRLVAVALRTPPSVTGDGYSTIGELMAAAHIEADHRSDRYLQEQGLASDSVLRAGEEAKVAPLVSRLCGGRVVDVTGTEHPSYAALCSRIAKSTGLDICGIDIVARDISLPIGSGNGVVIEVNPRPALSMHLSPDEGLSQNVVRPIMQAMFPDQESARIPLVAVSGTRGTTLLCRLIAQLSQQTGRSTGCSTTEGVWVNGNRIIARCRNLMKSAEAVLFDPLVDMAVIECTPQLVAKAGLPFEVSDVSIVTGASVLSATDDPDVKADEISSLIGVVACTTRTQGYAILNADDDVVLSLSDDLPCRVALYSARADNPAVIAHCKDGGLAAFAGNNCMVVQKGKWKVIHPAPDHFNEHFKIRSRKLMGLLMPAILFATVQGLDPTLIRGRLFDLVAAMHDRSVLETRQAAY